MLHQHTCKASGRPRTRKERDTRIEGSTMNTEHFHLEA
jgi:hypothetical protein